MSATMSAVHSEEEEKYVDFYELLDVWPDAEEEALRQRISQLYLEARENLDHRNHRKRFYYRELYEVQLPQARLVLLDAQKRSEYDKQLYEQTKRRSKSSAPPKPKPAPQQKINDGARATTTTAASQNSSNFSVPAELLLPPVPQRKKPRDLDPAVVERRRDNKRRELIKGELESTGLRWMLFGGVGSFLACGIVIFVLRQALHLNSPQFPLFAGLALLAVCVVSGREANRWAKRRIIGVLSKMPYDELLRQCGGR